MKNLKSLGSVLLVAGIMVFGTTSCTYDTIVYPEDPEVTEPVSYSEEIQPLWTDSGCDVSGCHNAGGWDPNLTPGNSYNALISDGFVDTTDPASSIIYTKLLPGASMEPYLIDPTADNRALILAWIEQGAMDN